MQENLLIEQRVKDNETYEDNNNEAVICATGPTLPPYVYCGNTVTIHWDPSKIYESVLLQDYIDKI